MSGTTVSRKVLKPEKLGPISELLLRVYPDFEKNYLSVNKKKVLELLSLHELELFMETGEVQEKLKTHELFREYTIVLFIKSIQKIERKNSEIIDDLFEYLHIVKNSEMEKLIESVSNYFYSK
jgi:hypothetical protein